MAFKTLTFLLVLLLANVAISQTDFSTKSFDNDWRFYKGKDSLASQVKFDDSKWRKLNLPHDWSIEDLPGTKLPFSPDAISGVSGGFTTGGTGWYRKTFSLSDNQKNKQIIIQFDGVYMNADVWINGEHLSNHPYGYTSFYYDITKNINPNGKNVIAVEVKNEGKNSRWYSGSGIYRHVWLKALNPLHIKQWGTAITTPVANATTATINIKTNVQNEANATSNIKLVTRIVDAKGVEKKTVSTTQVIQEDSIKNINQTITLAFPELWSLEHSTMYKAITELYQDNKLKDVVTTPFGIRTISFDAVNGFRLNGKTVKLKGGCVHNDNGPLGAKAYNRAEERKVQLLKESGYNAIRTSHNPPSPAFLDACDRLGMLVIDEAFDTWNEKKNKDDYNVYFNDWGKRDLESMVNRDRNHPSIIMWSIGNEIPNRTKPAVAAVAKTLSDYVKELDVTRPVTCGVNGIDQSPEAFLSALDIAGYNYAIDSYEPDHKRFPERVMLATESFPLEAYDYWKAVENHPWVIGDFVWTAFDYIGEASIGWLGYPQSKNFYPWNLAYCGDLDVCGWKRPQSFYRDALWMKNQLSIFVKPPAPTFKETNAKLEKWSKWNWQDVVADWNWNGHENQPLDVTIYSSCKEVELFLNNRSLGKKKTNTSTKYITTWQVPYTKGTLKAIGYDGSKIVKVSTLETANDVTKIKLAADRKMIKADGQDLSYITVELTDANGVRNPKAEDLIKFTIDGPATIAGVANANPKSIESFQSSQRKAWQGRCLVILKSTDKQGAITLKASAKGMRNASIIITSTR